MTVSADTLALLVAAGLSGEKLVEVVRSMEADSAAPAPTPRSSGAERQRRWRARNAEAVSRDVTRDVSGDASQRDADPLPLPPSPQTPQPPTPSPVVVSTRAREADSFARFWEAYPHKVGKGAAESKFAQALKRVSLAELLLGLERYRRSKPPDRPWCNPATWLHQQRWTDQPDEPEPSHERPLSRPISPSRAQTRNTVWSQLAAEEDRARAGRA